MDWRLMGRTSVLVVMKWVGLIVMVKILTATKDIWILWAGWKESSYSDPFLLQDIDIRRRMVRIGRMVKLT